MKSEIHKGMFIEVERMIKVLTQQREKLMAENIVISGPKQITNSAKIRLLAELINKLNQRKQKLIDVNWKVNYE